MSSGWNLGTLYLSLSKRGTKYHWQISSNEYAALFEKGTAKTEVDAFHDALHSSAKLLRLIAIEKKSK